MVLCLSFFGEGRRTVQGSAENGLKEVLGKEKWPKKTREKGENEIKNRKVGYLTVPVPSLDCAPMPS